MSITLINGEKPEFGNPKHIQVIKENEQYIKDFDLGLIGLDHKKVKYKIAVKIEFDCPFCGYPVTLKDETDGKESFEYVVDNVNGITDECNSCRCELMREYMVIVVRNVIAS